MPSGPLEVTPLIVQATLAVNPSRVLDLGMGTGKYGFLLREQRDLARGEWTLHLTGVEGYEPYVGGHQRTVYDEIVIADVRDFARDYTGEPFDLTLALDLIEHLAPEDVLRLAERILSISTHLLISTPTSYYAQDGLANELERHRSWWPRRCLRQLAAEAAAEIDDLKVGHVNVALLSRGRRPVLPRESVLRSALVATKDLVVPEMLYHRARHQTGPTLRMGDVPSKPSAPPMRGEQRASTRVHVLGCPIDAVTLDEAVFRADEAIASRRPCQHVAINAAKLVRFQDEPELRDAVVGCDLITADGQAVVWAGRFLGQRLPGRVAGIDLMEAILRAASRRGYRVFLLGARPGVLEAAAEEMERRFEGVVIVGQQHGYFRSEELDGIVGRIAAAAPDILFVALQTPRKEIFLARHRNRLAVPFTMGVGGAFDVLAGRRRRAPGWVRRIGLEWLYRLLQEPHRLAGRYIIGNTRFTWLVLREAVLRPSRNGRPS
jgi:N-acetylglucosaminyldiphosphoundecaprenol N-acetyl-beta-D-mannosaminyltransferase